MSLTPEQLEWRKRHITGSDVNRIIVGRALDVFLEKTGRREPTFADPWLLRAGQIAEPFIKDLARERYGLAIVDRNESIEHPTHKWLGGHIDGAIEGEPQIIECKNVGAHAARSWGEDGSDDIPDYYLGQPHTYMMLTNADLCHVLPWFGGADVRRYPIERDDELDELIIEASHELWQQIQRDEPPDIDYADGSSALADARRLYSRVTGDVVVLPDEIAAWHQVAQESDDLVKNYTKVRDGALAHIAEAMGDAQRGMLGDGSGYERKLIKRRGFTVEATEYLSMKHKREITQ